MRRLYDIRDIELTRQEHHQVLWKAQKKADDIIMRQNEGVETQVIRAVEGNLECLKELIELVASNDKNSLMKLLENVAFYVAVRHGHLDIVEYLVDLISVSEEKKVKMCRMKDEAFFIATIDGHLEIIRYLWELARVYNSKIDDYTIGAAYIEAMWQGKRKVLGYLLSLVQGLELEELIINLDLPDLDCIPYRSIKSVEYLLSVTTPNQAVAFVSKNIRPRVLLQAIKVKAMHTLWYSLDCKVSKNMLQQIMLGTSKISTLMYFSFLSAAATWMESSDLGSVERNILPSLYNKVPLIVRGNQAKSLLILDRMLSPVALLYSVCKGRDQFGIFSLLPELMGEILWHNIFEGMENLLPKKEHYLNVLGKICLFYSELPDDQIVIDSDNSIPEYHISYALSFLYNLKTYIGGHNEKK